MNRLGYSEWMAAIVVCAALVASWNDYRRHRVPNWLNGFVLLAGILTQALFSGRAGIEQAALGILVGAGPLFALWMMKVMGAGDVKFMGAIGAWMGPQATLNALIVGILVGGVMSLGIWVVKNNWRHASVNMGVMVTKMSSIRTAFSEFGSAASMNSSGFVLPYAIPLSVGTLVVMFSNYFGWWKAL